ncbi:hypothetical protein FRB91_010927 [Serendipita sp. 411]|nr:hypothetical protein FRC18_011406 [Serendipita sp. 400]KAG8848328.1 hypothetical protein FRB91_010927 [Serendipita sp. 411]
MAAAPRAPPKSMKVRYGDRSLRVFYGISLQNVKDQIKGHFQLLADANVLIGTEEVYNGRAEFVELSNELWDVVWEDPEVQSIVARVEERRPEPAVEIPVTPEFLERPLGTVTPLARSVRSRSSSTQTSSSRSRERIPSVEPERQSSTLEEDSPPPTNYHKNQGRSNEDELARGLPEDNDNFNLPTPPASKFSQPIPEGLRVKSPGAQSDRNSVRRATRSQRRTLTDPLSSRTCGHCRKLKLVCRRPIDGGSRYITSPEKYSQEDAMPCISCREKGIKCSLEDIFGVNIK